MPYIIVFVFKYYVNLHFLNPFLINFASKQIKKFSNAKKVRFPRSKIKLILFYTKLLKGERYWYVFPFIFYSVCSTLSAIFFILFVHETKDKKLVNTLEEFVHS
jgi:hypothetical protein